MGWHVQSSGLLSVEKASEIIRPRDTLVLSSVPMFLIYAILRLFALLLPFGNQS